MVDALKPVLKQEWRTEEAVQVGSRLTKVEDLVGTSSVRSCPLGGLPVFPAPALLAQFKYGLKGKELQELEGLCNRDGIMKTMGGEGAFAHVDLGHVTNLSSNERRNRHQLNLNLNEPGNPPLPLQLFQPHHLSSHILLEWRGRKISFSVEPRLTTTPQQQVGRDLCILEVTKSQSNRFALRSPNQCHGRGPSSLKLHGLQAEDLSKQIVLVVHIAENGEV